jgi:hypothetical protein
VLIASKNDLLRFPIFMELNSFSDVFVCRTYTPDFSGSVIGGLKSSAFSGKEAEDGNAVLLTREFAQEYVYFVTAVTHF